MKTKSKALLLTLCAVLLVAASVLGTMAYLTSTDTVTNTFTVGSVAIKLEEAKANPDGTLVEGADRVKGNAYKLLPGHTYNKDPMVTVLNGSEASYIKMTVTFSKADALDAILKSLFRRICSSRPGDGEQRGQSLAALTACDWGLYCFQPQRMAACLTCRLDVVCPSRLGGMMQACQGCPRRVSRSPEACCFRVVARAVRVSQPAV